MGVVGRDLEPLGRPDIAGDWDAGCADCPWWESQLSLYWAVGLAKVHAVTGHHTAFWFGAVYE